MRNALFAAFLLAAAALLAAGTAYSQEPGQPPVQNPQTAAPQPQPQPQPEMPKKESVVEVKDGKLSVELVDADLGTVMNQIGAKLGIPVSVGGAAYTKKITTKFSGVEIDRGIQRLFSLASETNYMLHYDAEGKLSDIVLYAESHSSSLTQQPARPSPFSRPPPRRRRYRRYVPPQPGQTAPEQPQPAEPAPTEIVR
jgi:hypothetical protein